MNARQLALSLRPEGPQGNSHDREVVDQDPSISIEGRRCGIITIRGSGLRAANLLDIYSTALTAVPDFMSGRFDNKVSDECFYFYF
jgi:hypothetical protein